MTLAIAIIDRDPKRHTAILRELTVEHAVEADWYTCWGLYAVTDKILSGVDLIFLAHDLGDGTGADVARRMIALDVRPVVVIHDDCGEAVETGLALETAGFRVRALPLSRSEKWWPLVESVARERGGVEVSRGK